MDPQLFRTALDGIDAGAYAVDEQERIIATNARAEELLGRPAADLLGRGAHDLLHRTGDGRSVPRSMCTMLNAFLSGRTAQGRSEWFARGDGTLLSVAWVVTPCRVNTDAYGALVLFHESEPEHSPHADTGHVAALSDLADRLALVAETTTVLTSTLELDEALRRLVRLVTPRLADWAIVDLISDVDELERVAVVHYHNGEHIRAVQLEGPMPPVPETSPMPLSRVLRGGPPTLVTPEDYTVPPDTGIAIAQRELFQTTRMHSAVTAPLRSLGGGVLGALTLGRTDQNEKFGPTEIALVDDIARRAGLAVDNAQLHERQRKVAATMQRHLLPPLPRTSGLEMAARYRSAPRASQVGGDWYDAFLLPDNATAVVIGDVVGHDLQAAARMSQIRNMLRAFAWDRREPPSLIVDRLDRAMLHISEAPMATMVFARVEGEVGSPLRLHWTNAGHPPPLLVHSDGRTHFLTEGHGVLLGTDAAPQRTDAVTPLPPLATVVFYTDGLIESPAHSLDEGTARLARHAAALVRRPLNDFCDQLIDRVRPTDNEDDIALIALRVPDPEQGGALPL